MNELISELAHRDQQGDALGALAIITKQGLSVTELLQLVIDLYEGHHNASAGLLAARLTEQGVNHWALDAVQAHVWILAGESGRSRPALTRLRRTLARLDPSSAGLCRRMLESRLSGDLQRLNVRTDADLILRLLELSKLATPVLESAFPRKVAPTSAERWAIRPNTRLLPVSEPPPRAGRQKRTVVVATSDYTVPGDRRSLPNAMGPRLMAAMAGYGWNTISAAIRSLHDPEIVAADRRAIVNACVETGADALFISETGLDLVPAEISLGFIAELRTRLPRLVIVMFMVDAWFERRWPVLKEAAARADFIWSPSPAVALWREPQFRGKMLFYPIPLGPPQTFPPLGPPLADGMRLSFTGSLGLFNYTRAYWLAALHKHGVDLHQDMSSLKADALPPLVSYDRYLKRLGTTGCSLNLTMRTFGARALVYRTFEAPWAGALMVEEDNDDVHHFFTPNEHFLTFSTFPELLEIVALIRDHPQMVNEIRRRGHAFAGQRYSDERVIGGIDLALLFRR